MVQGQSHTPSTPYHASFQLTYDQMTQEYTFWVVPNYSTPNQVNANTQESGVSAMVTLLVPKDFFIESFTRLVANWNELDVESKLGPGLPGQHLWPVDQIPPNVHYYTFLISPFSNYAPFTAGVPIPSFRFKGNGCFGDLRILEREDPITGVADEVYSLDLGNRFNARTSLFAIFAATGSLDIENHYLNNVGPNASCFLQTELVAQADTFQVNPGISTAQFAVLKNDDKNRIPVTVRDTRVRVLDPPAHGSWLVSESNQIVYQSTTDNIPSFSFQYEVCLLSEPTQCDTATVVVQGSGLATTRIVQCESEESILSVPDGWVDVRWFRDGILVGSGPSFVARESGRYSVRAANQTCPAEGCLEIQVITEVCCPDSLRIPTQARKVRRR